MRLDKLILLLIFIVIEFFSIKPIQASFSIKNKDSSKSDILTTNGHVYFNVTHSGLQGERYLLNQQLTNIKLNSDLRLTEWSRVHSLLIYNSTPNPLYPRFYPDELYVELQKSPLSKWRLIGGRKWLPFGYYKNDLIYKPTTKALGQINEYALVVGYNDDYYSNLAIFSPRSRIQSSSLPLYYTINMGFKNTKSHPSYDTGISYLYSIADSNIFQYNKGFGGFLFHKIRSDVPGIATYANLRYKQWTTYLTYVSALTSFRKNELSYQNKGAMPAAASIQIGYEFTYKNKRFKVINFYDKSYQSLALRLAEKRIGMGFNFYPSHYLDIQFQYSKDFNYKTGITASGLNKKINGHSTPSNTFALQFVFNF